ncbi:MAG: aminodeoxychorismate synthase, component I [Myxococcales bacterium 68-20]|nr:MAG: aminodeoxychorismate synthase, component I [Myxococcales bacterium 68-20]
MTTSRKAFHLTCELDASISPEAFRAAFPERGASSFVLEGGGAPSTNPQLDRAAFMGAAPIATFRARRTAARDSLGRTLADVVIERASDRRDAWSAVDPFTALRDFVSANAVPRDVFDGRHPFPFRGGLVGYIGYECGQMLERLPCIARPSVGMPDMAFALHRWVIATSRTTGKSWLSVIGLGPDRATARQDAEDTRDHVLRTLAERSSAPRERANAKTRRPFRVEAGLSASEYMDRVATAKDHIAAGDAFEICMTNALRAPLARGRAWSLFDELRRSNPAPFAAFLDLPEGTIVSSSPERFLSLDAHGIAESRPIKGTRPRGATPEDDARLARELVSSEKDRAENAMIVDLVRNDLGRVCRYGTVEAPDLFAVEPYATVHQLVSTVRGELDADKDAIDLLRATFPPGSMTGAPKIEAMSILERLEPAERGVYSGALGWIDLGGAMDLSVVIRTVVVKDDTATFSVGGAIVADSDPRDEHEETVHKGRALVRALETLSRQDEPHPTLGERP